MLVSVLHTVTVVLLLGVNRAVWGFCGLFCGRPGPGMNSSMLVSPDKENVFRLWVFSV